MRYEYLASLAKTPTARMACCLTEAEVAAGKLPIMCSAQQLGRPLSRLLTLRELVPFALAKMAVTSGSIWRHPSASGIGPAADACYGGEGTYAWWDSSLEDLYRPVRAFF